MRSLKWFGAAALLALLAAPDALAAARVGAVPSHRPTVERRAPHLIDNDDRMDVNNLDMVVTNHGSLAYDLVTGNAGLIYPKNTLRTAVFAAGLWIGAKVAGDIRIAVGEYSQEFTPGPMSGGTFLPDEPAFRNFRFVRGEPISAADSVDYITQGGPTDSLGNIERIGDAMIWSVFNDADPGQHTNEAGSTLPLGVEVQQSVFAFNQSGALGNVIFVKWRFINKGANTLDSTYVSVWSDPDLGGFLDDLVGCDTTLSLGFCYNATNTDQQYGTSPPAVGYDFFKGPTVGGTPLGMTSFNKYVSGTDPSSQVETYNYMKGLNSNGTPVHVQNDPLLPITTYQVSGLNVAGANTPTNWLDSNAGDRRLMLSSGPFTMAPGDTQEVVTAIIIGQGANRTASVLALKCTDIAAQRAFDLNFDIPQPPPSPTVFTQELDRRIRLTWDRTAVGTSSAKGTQDFVFEGYRVWQLPSEGATEGGVVIATFDQTNLVSRIYSDVCDDEVGLARSLSINAADEGLQFTIDITSDAIRGGSLVNYKDYYFAVTAYSYDSLNTEPYVIGVPANEVGIVSDVLESGINVIRAVPKGSNAVYVLGATQIDGNVVGNQVQINQLTPSIGDSTYQIVIGPTDDVYSVYNVTSGDTIATNQSGQIVNGWTPTLTQTTNPSLIFQLEGGTGLLGATDSTNMMTSGAVVDSSGTYVLSNYLWYPDGPVDMTLFDFGDVVQHDYLIRALPDTTQFGWDYHGGGISFPLKFKIPFEIWDLGACSLEDPSDDVKMSVMVRELGDVDGRWDWGDAIYVRRIPYASIAWGSPNDSSLNYTGTPDADAESQTLGRFTFYQAPGSPATLPTDGRFLVRSNRFCPGDVFQFRTVPAGTAEGTVVKNDMTRVRAVPNPYYARSQYELTQFDRVLKFTNIPASSQVTIRIFNLAGDLVRTIRRSASAGDDMTTSQVTWDLNTENRLPVASGIYIARIEVAGVGDTTLRVAVFVEQERLDNF